MKRVLSLVLALVLVLGMIPMGFAADATAGQMLKGYGIIVGDETGNLNEDQNLNRAEMMVVLARMMGKGGEAETFALPSTFTDLEGFGWAVPWIAYAEMNDWTEGVGANMFNPAGNVTAQEAAVFMLKALGYEADVDFNWTNAVEFATAKGLFAGVSTPAGSAILRGDLFTMMITTLNTEVKSGAGKLGIVLGYMEEEVLKIVSVKALNLKQIEVAFNMDVEDNDDATEVGNYEFEGEDADGNDTEGVIDADANGKVVVVTLEEAVDNQSEGLLTIDKAVVGEELEFEVDFFDSTLPTVTGAEVVGNDTIKVMFSEPIDFGTLDADGYADAAIEDEFELNDGDFFVKSVKPAKNNTEANIEFYTEFETDTYVISVGNGLEDYAGFNVIPKDIELKVVEDTTAPKLVGYKDATLTKVTLIFDEDIEPADNADTLDLDLFFHTNSNNTAKTAVIDGNEIDITFDDDYKMPNGTAYVYVDDEAVQDLWDNVNEQRLVIAVQAVADETAPTVEKVEVDEQDVLIVTFNEELDEETAQKEANYTLLDKDGDEVDVDNATLQVNDDDELVEVVLELEDEIYGEFTLKVINVEDIAGNAMKSQSITFEAEDATAPEFPAKATLYDVNDDYYTVVIDFDDEMAIEGRYSILDVEKYQINGFYLDEFDSSDVKLAAIDGNEKVRIDIKKDNDAGTNDADLVVEVGQSIYVSRVADAAGNYTQLLRSDAIVIDPATNVAVDKVEATDNNKVVITLDGKITKFDAEDFVVYYTSGSAVELQAVGARLNNTGADSVITITLDEDENELTDDAKFMGKEVFVKTVAQVDVDSANAYGEKVLIVSELVEDLMAPALAEVDNVDGDEVEFVYFVENYTTDDNWTVVLNFTEDIDGATVSKFDFEVENVDVDDVLVVANKIYLFVNVDGDEDADDMPEFGTNVTQKGAIYDMSGNAVTGISTEIDEFDM